MPGDPIVLLATCQSSVVKHRSLSGVPRHRAGIRFHSQQCSERINRSGGKGVLAPGGGAAYGAAANNTTGAIGVTGNAVEITVVRPSYQDYSANVSTNIVAADEA